MRCLAKVGYRLNLYCSVKCQLFHHRVIRISSDKTRIEDGQCSGIQQKRLVSHSFHSL